MTIEKEVFKRKKIVFDKLLKVGFRKISDGYFYSKVFSDGEFRADITVSQDGTVTGKVIEIETEEEYLPLRTEMKGAFVSAIRDEYKRILCMIAGECCVTVPFLFEQSNRLAAWIAERYGESPDYPFVKLPDYGVFRSKGTKKWYAIIMNLKKKTITKRAEDEVLIEVMNVKIDPKEKDDLLKTTGIYTCYHMNKENWVTVLLDDTLSDERVRLLVENSRNLIIST